MPLADLTEAEKEVIYDCLACVAEGKVIAHDWEFQTLFGLEPQQVQAVVDAWPRVDDADEMVSLAINNSLNSLLGLVDDGTFSRHVSHAPKEVARILAKWRGSPVGGYFDGLR